MPTKRSDAVTTEARLLRTIAKLTETLAVSQAVAIAQYDPALIGRAGTLVRLTLESLHERFMDGRLDLMQATTDDIESSIDLAVAAAAGKLLGTAPEGVAAPLAPNQVNPGVS